MIKVSSGREKYIIKVEQFPDGSLNMKNLPYSINTILWNYENDAELFTIICLRKHYCGEDWLQLRMPYVPHARVDRVKNVTENFSLKHFCDTINWLNFNEVWICDPHSNVTPALLNRVYVQDNSFLINYAKNNIGSNDLIAFYPDEGAMKRYSDRADLPYAFGIKKRNWEDGKILGLDIFNKEEVAGKDILIIDDICSRGGTFFHSAKALKEAGAKDIYLCITHCEDTMTSGEMYHSNLIKHIYTTDSIFTQPANSKITKIEV